jgi:hypothetical protein
MPAAGVALIYAHQRSGGTVDHGPLNACDPKLAVGERETPAVVIVRFKRATQ